ncbi:Hint domain-containing protein [Pararhodobacter zhoushanensis]|uniref:Hint domain-containing protein n=1 Tax=Pararhodobacter zhoushanensis TaxID=2479545 RepID=A0ABT3GXA2_9RHOB|nr:Hint domain-containing protein [Pararhodobacter zhoushanensis]MCW1932174.1 Hint domain-containing protein [Pararhodobacter zhoushanensis]
MSVVSNVSGSVYAYSGSLLDLYAGNLLGASVLNAVGGGVDAEFSDNNGQLTADESGTTTVSVDGGADLPMTYLGTGTVATISVVGLEIDPRTVMIFEVGGQIYLHAPDGLPILSSLSVSFDVDPNAPFDLTAAPDGAVDGLDTGEVMNVGYVDLQGDDFTNTGSLVNAHGGDDTVYGGLGDDTINGGAGADSLFGGDGNDLLNGGLDNDTIWGDAGDDTLNGNEGDDKLIGGTGNDLLDGGDGDNLMFGDNVDGDTGGLEPSDPPEVGYGSDTLVMGTGNDTAYGGSGDDFFHVFDDFGNHQIIGGETGETLGDKIDATPMTQDTSVVYTADEQGTMDNGTNIADFSEIERLFLGSGDDNVEVITSTTGFVHGGSGFDTLVLPDPAPGDPAPVVTVTSEIDNGDGTTSKTGYVDFPDGSRMDFESFEEIICFTPGTLIDTTRGRVAVEDLVIGDKVLTRDHGYQDLTWTGRRDLTQAELASCPSAAPIRIKAGALGRDLPERDLTVSPRHRMLVTGARAELMFGEREVLVAAADLLGLPGVEQVTEGAVSYIHVMCEAHQIIRAEGSWTESFQPAEAVINALESETRAELLGLFPELATQAGRDSFTAARPVLTGAEAKTLFAA